MLNSTCEAAYAKHTLRLDPFINFHRQITRFSCDFQLPTCTKFQIFLDSALGTRSPTSLSWWGGGSMPCQEQIPRSRSFALSVLYSAYRTQI